MDYSMSLDNLNEKLHVDDTASRLRIGMFSEVLSKDGNLANEKVYSVALKQMRGWRGKWSSFTDKITKRFVVMKIQDSNGKSQDLHVNIKSILKFLDISKSEVLKLAMDPEQLGRAFLKRANDMRKLMPQVEEYYEQIITNYEKNQMQVLDANQRMELHPTPGLLRRVIMLAMTHPVDERGHVFFQMDRDKILAHVHEGKILRLYNIKPVRTLGIGGYGQVAEVTDLMLSAAKAMKIPRMDLGKERAAKSIMALINEYEILNIINPNGDIEWVQKRPSVLFDIKNQKGYITQIYSQDLLRYLQMQDPSIQIKMDFCKKMLQAVAFLEESGVVHKDISLENFIIERDRIFLIDFGCARPLDDYSSELVGTQKDWHCSYQDITRLEKYQRELNDRLAKSTSDKTGMDQVNEIIPNREEIRMIQKKRDCFSLGICMYRLLTRTIPNRTPTGSIPKQNLTSDQVCEILTQAVMKTEVEKVYARRIELISKLLNPNAEERISAKDALVAWGIN